MWVDSESIEDTGFIASYSRDPGVPGRTLIGLKGKKHLELGDQFAQDVVACLPRLRAFSRQLARNYDLAEDMVQETILRALTFRDQFQPGTNLHGWLTTILRNRYFSQLRQWDHKGEIQMDLEQAGGSWSGGQEEALAMRDFRRAFVTLPAEQREALTLVGASGLSYEEAAQISGCALGTMKSRVSRGRSQLQILLSDPISPKRQRPMQADQPQPGATVVSAA
jgi:RNA polymerase sigma-70 factor (ECF subfamily)